MPSLAARVFLTGVAGARRRGHHVRRPQAADLNGALGQHVEALADHPDALAHLVDAHLVAIEHIAVLAQGHVEVKLGINRVRSRAAQFVLDAGGARIGARDGIVGDILLREHALADRTLQEDGVVVDEFSYSRILAGKMSGSHGTSRPGRRAGRSAPRRSGSS